MQKIKVLWPGFVVQIVGALGCAAGCWAAGPAPAIQSVVNAASFQDGLTSGAWVSIFGTNLSTTARPWESSDFDGSSLPTSLDSVTVTVNGVPAFPSYVSPTQVNALIPSGIATDTVAVQVVNSGGTSNSLVVKNYTISPAVFAYSTQNTRYAAAQDAQTFEAIAPPDSLGAGLRTRAALPGEILALYVNGLGSTSPAYPNGQTIAISLPVTTQPQVLIGNLTATVRYAGIIGAGLYQLNVVVPDLPSGDASIVISEDGVLSPPGIVIPVQGRSGTGTLQIDIQSQPGTPTGSVSVTSATGQFKTTITSSQTLQVPADQYSIVAASVPGGDVSYAAVGSHQVAVVTAGSTVSVAVAYTVAIRNTTKTLDPVGLQGAVVPSSGNILYVPASSAVAQALKTGDVLAFGIAPATPRGLLVKVLAVSTAGSQIAITTAPATISDAIQAGSVSYTTQLTGSQAATAVTVQSAATPKLRTLLPNMEARQEPRSASASSGTPCPGAGIVEVRMFNAPFSNLTLNGQISICASFQFNWDLSGTTLNAVKAIATVGGAVDVNATGTLQASTNREIPVATITGPPEVILVGEIPIVYQPSATLFVGYKASGSASLSVGMHGTASVSAGINYVNGAAKPTPILTSTLTYGPDPVGLDAQLVNKAYAGASFQVLLDEILAPEIRVDDYLQATVAPLQTPWWTLVGGVEGSASVSLSPLGVTLSTLGPVDFPPIERTISTSSGSFAPAPTINTLSPNSATAGNSGLNVTLTGKNFVPTATLNINGNIVPTTFISPVEIRATIPAIALALPGTFPVTVTNPDSPDAVSQAVTFSVLGSSGSTSARTYHFENLAFDHPGLSLSGGFTYDFATSAITSSSLVVATPAGSFPLSQYGPCCQCCEHVPYAMNFFLDSSDPLEWTYGKPIAQLIIEGAFFDSDGTAHIANDSYLAYSTEDPAAPNVHVLVGGRIVPDAVPRIQIPSLKLPDSVSGTRFAQKLSVIGGTGTGYVWRDNFTFRDSASIFYQVLEGQLRNFFISPDGTISSSENTPSPPGTYTFPVYVTDSAGNPAAANITLNVRPAQ